MVSSEKDLPESFNPGTRSPSDGRIDLITAQGVQWATHIGSYTCATPVVAEGKVLIGSVVNGKGVLKCLDAATGRRLWQWIAPPRDVPAQINGRPFLMKMYSPMLGVSSTPAVENGRGYIVTHRCEVLCLDLAGDPARIANVAACDAATTAGRAMIAGGDTSRVLWKYDMWNAVGTRPADACHSSILLHGDFLYLSTSNGVDRYSDVRFHDETRKPPMPDAPNLIVLEKHTGRLAAVDGERRIGHNLMHGQWSSPSLGRVAGRTLIFYGAGDGRLYAFEALKKMPERPVTLKTAWSFDCNPPEYRAACLKTPGMDPIKHYCLDDWRRSDSTNKRNDGMWVGTSQIIATPVFYDNKVYVAIGRDPAHGRGWGALWCINPAQTGSDITKTGTVWCYEGLDRSISTVSIADGLLYIADVGGRLHCLDARTGQLYWVHETKAEVWGSTLVADGKVYLPTHKGLWVFTAGKTKKVLSQINMGAPLLASPVAANGTLYLASKNYLWAVGKK